MIIFMGVAGSGKSTLGQLLAAHLQCPWVSTGNLLRQKMDAKTQIDMLQGKIIDDTQTLGVLDDEFQRIGAEQNEFILDGSPRTMTQAEWLTDKINSGQIKLTAIVHLQTAKEVAKKRLLKRGRPDDNEAAIAERFDEYDKTIVPILDFLKSQGHKVYEIQSEGEPEVVEARILEVLGVKDAA